MNFAFYQLVIGIAIFISVTTFIIFIIKVLKTPYGKYEERYLENATGQLDQMFIFLPPETILYLKFIAAVFLGLSFFFLFSNIKFNIVQYTVSIGMAIFGFLLPDLILKHMQKVRIEKFDIQLVEALQALTNALKAGFSFPQALEQVVKDGKPPFSQEFALVLKENKLGISLEKALGSLTKRVDSEDLYLVVSSIVLTRELGGNLANIFERLAHTIRERMKLQGKIQALTSQGKMQGWVVGLMPLVLGLIMSVISPTMIDAFFNSIVGWILVGLMIALEITGGLVIKKIVTIDV